MPQGTAPGRNAVAGAHFLILMKTLVKARSKATGIGGQRSIVSPGLGVAPALPQD